MDCGHGHTPKHTSFFPLVATQKHSLGARWDEPLLAARESRVSAGSAAVIGISPQDVFCRKGLSSARYHRLLFRIFGWTRIVGMNRFFNGVVSAGAGREILHRKAAPKNAKCSCLIPIYIVTR